jgi:beta-lactamase superfamily II metal-dependent hydrolase
MRVSLLALVLLVCLTGIRVQAKPSHNLKIYFIDVEGGAATLIVTPAGESVLLDAGWDTPDGRDAKRIQQAMQSAGITTIDHLVVSHYHRDHYGGVPEFSRLVPVKHFYDHGKMTALSEDAQFAQRYGAYQAAAKGESITLKPGDTIPLKTIGGGPPIALLCVASNAALLEGNTKPNPGCDSTSGKTTDTSENGRSVGLWLSWGKFDFLNLADLTASLSPGLICPANQVGEMDLYQATHHGSNLSNHPFLLRSLNPTVTVIINGPRKGGHPDTIKGLQSLPAFKAVYQLHRNVESTTEQNAPAEFIANLNAESEPDAGNLIAVEVNASKRTFEVTNTRTKSSQTYRLK